MKTLSMMVVPVVVTLAAAPALGQRSNNLQAELEGFQEVPALSTAGGGSFRARINNAETEIEYELSYANLEGNLTQAHIHVGQHGVNGAISVFLCTNLTPPAGVPTPPACPPSPATVTGTLRAADVLCTGCTATNPAGQGIAAGEFAELLVALRAGVTYVNVHTTKWPAGEIRGQVR